jgi:hypothetical protein
MSERESALEALLVRAVRSMGGVTSKIAPLVAGVPDRLVLLPGGTMELVELKTETGRVSEIQRVWHARAAEIGTTVIILSGRGQVEAWASAHRARLSQTEEP